MSDIWRSEASRLQPGTRLNGIYEIERRIAAGGMGEIYRGRAVETGDAVAIKVMRTDLADNAATLALFRKEASALHDIQHDAIVRYYVFSSDPVLRRHYLAMEFVDGRPLRDLLRDGPLTFEAVRLLQQRLAAGLHAAHQHGIIHRDISPDNILIPGGDVARAKIIDFGIARSTRIGAGTLIGSGFAGKCNYVSPEQLGLFGGNATAKSDIYSLGLVLAECLTGQAIDMGGSEVEVVEKRQVLPNLGAVDLRYRPLLEHMLQPDPNDRPESMAVIAAWRPDVAYRGVRGVAARGRGKGVVPGAKRAPKPKSRAARWLAGAALAVVLLLGIGSVALSLFYSYLPTLYGYIPIRLTELVTPAPAPPVPPRTNPPSAPPPLSPAAAGSAAPAIRPETDAGQRIARFLTSYQGGDCFFAAPVKVADDRASIDAYFATTAPFEMLQNDFKRATGFDATVNALRVTPQQCAAITLLSRLRGAPAAAPRLDISAATLRSGSTMNGTVAGFGDRAVELLLVADDGLVYNMTSRLTPGADGTRTFGFAIKLVEPGTARPQLLLVVASGRPLDALKPGRTGAASLGAADDVFARAQNEARQTGQMIAASARYFRLEN